MKTVPVVGTFYLKMKLSMIFNLKIIVFIRCSLFSLSKINKVKDGGTQDLFKYGLIIKTIVVVNTFLYFLQAFIVQITSRKSVKKTKYSHFLFIFVHIILLI